jgi:multisubunit Na+/H+ antiporter MnhE subunit
MVDSSSSKLGAWAVWLTVEAEVRMGAKAAAMPVTALACKRARRDSLFDRMIPRTLAQCLALPRFTVTIATANEHVYRQCISNTHFQG